MGAQNYPVIWTPCSLQVGAWCFLFGDKACSLQTWNRVIHFDSVSFGPFLVSSGVKSYIRPAGPSGNGPIRPSFISCHWRLTIARILCRRKLVGDKTGRCRHPCRVVLFAARCSQAPRTMPELGFRERPKAITFPNAFFPCLPSCAISCT